MERVDFEDVTVAELKEMLRQRGKHGGGKKADLIKRLQSEIDIIRANRQARLSAQSPATSTTSGPSAPSASASLKTVAAANGSLPQPPLASPTHNLYKTLHGLHIGSPPLQQPGTTTLSHSNLRYSTGSFNESSSPGVSAIATWKEV